MTDTTQTSPPRTAEEEVAEYLAKRAEPLPWFAARQLAAELAAAGLLRVGPAAPRDLGPFCGESMGLGTNCNRTPDHTGQHICFGPLDDEDD